MRHMVGVMVLLAAGRAGAQAPAQDPARSLVGIDTLHSFLVTGRDTAFTGYVIDEISVVEVGGRSMLRRVYRTQDRILGAGVDTLFSDPATLKPFSVRSRSTTQGRHFVTFGNGRALGHRVMLNQDTILVDVAMPDDAYDSSSFDLFIRSVALGTAWKAEMRAFVVPSRSVMPMSARVTGSELVDGADSWRVQAEFAGMPVTFWVDKVTRRMVRQVMSMGPGAEILMRRPQQLGRSGSISS